MKRFLPFFGIFFCSVSGAFAAQLPPEITFTPIALPTTINHEWVGGSNTDTADFTNGASWSTGVSPYSAGGNDASGKGNVVIRSGDVLAQRIVGVAGGTNLFIQSSLTSGNFDGDSTAHINNGGSINLLDGASMTYLITYKNNPYWTNYIGNGSKGTFNIQNATLTMGMFLYLGREANQDAVMNVVGPQAKVLVNGTQVNGNWLGRSTDVCGWGKFGGTATLNVLDGAYFFAGNTLSVAQVGELKGETFKPVTGYVNLRGGKLEVNGNIRLGLDRPSFKNAEGVVTATSYAYGEMNVWGASQITANQITVGESGEGAFRQWDGVTGVIAFDVGTAKADGRASLTQYGGEIRGKTTGSATILNVGTVSGETGEALLAGGTFAGSTLTLGSSDGKGTGSLTLAGGNASFTGNAVVSAGSSLNFALGPNGFGSLTIGGSVSENTAVKIGFQDAVVFAALDPDQAAQVLTVNGGGTLTVTNQAAGFFREALSGNDLTITMNQDAGSAFQGTYAMNSGSQSLTGEAGWVSVVGGDENPCVLALEFTGMNAGNQAKFVDWLDEQTALEVAAGDSVDSVILRGWDVRVPEVFLWNFADFNAQGNAVALAGISAKNVPEPSAWLILLLGLPVLMMKRKQKMKKIL